MVINHSNIYTHLKNTSKHTSKTQYLLHLQIIVTKYEFQDMLQ